MKEVSGWALVATEELKSVQIEIMGAVRIEIQEIQINWSAQVLNLQIRILSSITISKKFLSIILFSLISNTTKFLNTILFTINRNIILLIEIRFLYIL